jgi:hypothetical protein
VTLVSDIKARIEDTVSALNGALDEVADLTALVEQNALPQRSPAGFVIALGFDGRGPEDFAGAFVQSHDRAIAVVLVVSAKGDPKAKRALGTIDTLEADVIDAVSGYVPEGALGPVTARRGRLVSVTAGAVIYQIDFAVQTQVRKASP